MPRTWVRSWVVMTVPTCRRAQVERLASSSAMRMYTSSRGIRSGAWSALGRGWISAIEVMLTGLFIPHFRGYNAQDVGARTVVRAAPGMPLGRAGDRRGAGLEPGPPRGRPGPGRRGAHGPAAVRRPDSGVPGSRAAGAPGANTVGDGRRSVSSPGPADHRGGSPGQPEPP